MANYSIRQETEETVLVMTAASPSDYVKLLSIIRNWKSIAGQDETPNPDVEIKFSKNQEITVSTKDISQLIVFCDFLNRSEIVFSPEKFNQMRNEFLALQPVGNSHET